MNGSRKRTTGGGVTFLIAALPILRSIGILIATSQGLLPGPTGANSPRPGEPADVRPAS